jgi:hypothetical protein
MNIDWRGWTVGQWVLRAVLLVAPVLAVLVRGDAPLAWVLVPLALSVGWALMPESILGVVVLVVVGGFWARDSSGVPAEAMAAAAAMLVAHLAALVLGYGPHRLPIRPEVVRLWAVRGALVFPAAVLAWLLARGVRELPDSRTVWVVGLAVAVSVVVVTTAALQSLMPQGDDE